MISLSTSRSILSQSYQKRSVAVVLLLGALSLGPIQNLQADPTPTPTPVPTPGPDGPESPSDSSGPVTVNFAYDGAKTTISYIAPTGSLAGLAYNSTTSGSAQLKFTSGELFHVVGSSSYDVWGAGTSSPTWGPGGDSGLSASSSTGDLFAIVSNGFWVPAGYDLFNGSTLSGSMTFLGTSLVELGFGGNTDLSGSFTVGNTTISWSTSATAVPEPATSAVLIAFAAVALVAFGGTRRGAKNPPES